MTFLQVYVGRRTIDNRSVVNVDVLKLKVGLMVAIFQKEVFAQIKRLPIIGKIIDVEDDDQAQKWVQVELWNGSYSGKWCCPKNPQLEWVTVEAVILYDFVLTNKGHLHGHTKDDLKNTYSKLMIESE